MTRRFNVPPGWPVPSAGWTPPPGWQPDPSWPPPPTGWQLWLDENPARPVRAPWLRIGAAGLWLLFLITGAASSGVAGFLLMLGLPVLIIGLAAIAIGHVRWAWLGRRLTGAVAAATGFTLLIVGTAAGSATSTVGNSTSGGRPAASADPASPADITPSRPPTYQIVDVDGVPEPDPTMTPGSVLPGVSTDVVCSTSWVRAHRSVSTAVIDAVFGAYGITASHRAGYELDHLIPTELGGDGTVANLWPQPRTAASPQATAAAKDRLEQRLRDLVCAHRLPLATAQHDIDTSWGAAYTRYLPVAAPPPTILATQPPAPTHQPAPAPKPTTVTPPPAPADPAGVTAQCNDGTYSYSKHRRGTCSHHGGVARWINRPPS